MVHLQAVQVGNQRIRRRDRSEFTFVDQHDVGIVSAVDKMDGRGGDAGQGLVYVDRLGVGGFQILDSSLESLVEAAIFAHAAPASWSSVARRHDDQWCIKRSGGNASRLFLWRCMRARIVREIGEPRQALCFQRRGPRPSYLATGVFLATR